MRQLRKSSRLVSQLLQSRINCVVVVLALVTDDQTKIPELVQQRAQELLISRADRTVEQHQEVDVRVET